MTDMVRRPWGPSWAWTGAPAQVTERAWNASEVDYWAEPLQGGGEKETAGSHALIILTQRSTDYGLT